jgi:hypothetical protein
MRRIWGALLGAGVVAAALAAPSPALAAPCPTGDPASPGQLRADVSYLAAAQRKGRAPGTKGDRKARQFIAKRFRCLGLEPAGDDGGFQRRFRTSERLRTANVVGVLPAADPARRSDILVIGAHHDHLGRERGKIFAGANDNASGTAALLSLAATLSARSEPLDRPVIFAAFGAEEESRTPPHLEGSVRFLRDMPNGFERDEIAQMINLDMVGTYHRRKGVQVYGPRRGDVRWRAVEEARDGTGELRLRYPGNASPGYSDAWPFHRRGIPTTFFHTPDPDCYHSPCDRPSALRYEPMSRIVRLAGGTAERLAGIG